MADPINVKPGLIDVNEPAAEMLAPDETTGQLLARTRPQPADPNDKLKFMFPKLSPKIDQARLLGVPDDQIHAYITGRAAEGVKALHEQIKADNPGIDDLAAHKQALDSVGNYLGVSDNLPVGERASKQNILDFAQGIHQHPLNKAMRLVESGAVFPEAGPATTALEHAGRGAVSGGLGGLALGPLDISPKEIADALQSGELDPNDVNSVSKFLLYRTAKSAVGNAAGGAVLGALAHPAAAAFGKFLERSGLAQQIGDSALVQGAAERLKGPQDPGHISERFQWNPEEMPGSRVTKGGKPVAQARSRGPNGDPMGMPPVEEKPWEAPADTLAMPGPRVKGSAGARSSANSDPMGMPPEAVPEVKPSARLRKQPAMAAPEPAFGMDQAGWDEMNSNIDRLKKRPPVEDTAAMNADSNSVAMRGKGDALTGPTVGTAPTRTADLGGAPNPALDPEAQALEHMKAQVRDRLTAARESRGETGAPNEEFVDWFARKVLKERAMPTGGENVFPEAQAPTSGVARLRGQVVEAGGQRAPGAPSAVELPTNEVKNAVHPIRALVRNFVNGETGTSDAGALGKAASDVKEVGRAFSANNGAPAEYVAAKRQMSGEIGKAFGVVSKTTNVVKKLPLAVRQALDPVIEGGRDLSMVKPEARKAVQEALTAVDPLLDRINQLEKEFVARGLVPEVEAAGRQYVRTIYLDRLASDTWRPPGEKIEAFRDFLRSQGKTPDGRALSAAEIESEIEGRAAGKRTGVVYAGNNAPTGPATGLLKAKTNVPKAVAEFDGLVKDGALRSIQTFADSATLGEQVKFFDRVREMMPRLHEEGAPTASLKLTPLQEKITGYKSGEVVPRWFAEDVKDMFYHEEGIRKTMNEAFGGALPKAVDYLKFNNVVLRASSWKHHTMGLGADSYGVGNSVFNPENFIRHYLPTIRSFATDSSDVVYSKALKKMVDVGDLAMGVGAVEPGGVNANGRSAIQEFARQVSREQMGANDTNSVFRALLNTAQKTGQSLEQLRGSLDPIFRQAAFRKGIVEGLATHDPLGALWHGIPQAERVTNDPVKLASHINDFFPTYGESGRVFKEISRTPGVAFYNNPFFRIQIEQLRIAKNMGLRKPLAAIGAGLATYGAMNWGHALHAVTDAEYAAEAAKAESRRPDYQRFPAKVAMLSPIGRDARGKPIFYDATHDLPVLNLLGNYTPDPGDSGLAQVGKGLSAMVEHIAGGGFFDDQSAQFDKVPHGKSWEQKIGGKLVDLATPAPLQESGPLRRGLNAAENPRGPGGEPRSVPREVAAGLGFNTFEANPKRMVNEKNQRMHENDVEFKALKGERKTGKVDKAEFEAERNRLKKVVKPAIKQGFRNKLKGG